jgi:DHA3 family macrolide efflux protein-like MFS transporter
VLVTGIVGGLLAGLLLGGSISNFVANSRRLRWLGLLALGAIVRFGTEIALNAGVSGAAEIRLPLFAFAFALLLAGCWANRSVVGFGLILAGTFANLVPILLNGGSMPIWAPALTAAGFTQADVHSAFHTIIYDAPGPAFLLRGGPLADIIPVPFPIIQNVLSVGDLILAVGLSWFAFAAVLRHADEPSDQHLEELLQGQLAGSLSGLTDVSGMAGAARLPRSVEATVRGSPIQAETGLTAGLAEASALERALVLGGRGVRLASPALAPLPTEFEPAPGVERRARPVGRAGRAGERAGVLGRVSRHPYLRLALNSSFSALWVGQLISLLGDRVHQIAIAALILRLTDNSPIALAAVFIAASIPNLILGPIAGTFVDRWDHPETMVVSDLLRAAMVLLIPLAAVSNFLLVYPLLFLITSVSLFFRPARTAIMPRIVRSNDLLAANSATWIAETFADIGGYPLAALFVAFLGEALPLAFWVDAVSYVASAVLIGSMAVPRLRRRARRGGGAVREDTTAEPKPDFRREMLEGWHFLRHETVLLANTIQGVVGQFAIGATIAITALYATVSLDRGNVPAMAAYGFLETGVGVGNLIGGFAVGLIGARLAKGRMVIAGYTMWGICVAALGLTRSLPLAIGLLTATGVANMIFVIPSQTLFQQRTPQELIGRVVGFRIMLVFGSMTLAMAVAGLLATVTGPAAVMTILGTVTIVSGLAGLFVPAVRDA